MTRSWASLPESTGSADLWHPQLDAVADQDGEGHAELVAVERALRLANYHRVVAQFVLQADLQNATPFHHDQYYWVLAAWAS